ncbi:MAG: PKD domain-containing protein [Bacteroidota bacterium]|nr:PKD domain-containing protein [Bacteroidota bacterium]
MKKVFNKIWLLVLMSFSLNAQNSYTVTSASLGSVGSIDLILPQAIADANTGNNVTVLFDAPGIVQVSSSLPTITISAGSLTFDKSPTTNFTQGLNQSLPINTTNILYGFSIDNCTAPVTIKNLDFSNFFKINASANSAIYASNSSISVLNNSFIDNMASVTLQNSNATITSNTFTSQREAHHVFIRNQNNSAGTINASLLNNTFNKTGTSSQVYGVELRNYDVNLAGQVSIVNNNFNSIYYGILINNSLPSFSIGSTYALDIVGNNIICTDYNIVFDNPFKHFNVSGNTLSAGLNNVAIYCIQPNLNNVCGLDFINSNTLNYAVKNQNNTFVKTGNLNYYKSISVAGNFGAGLNFIGQVLPGSIEYADFSGGNPLYSNREILFRENSISSTVVDDPISTQGVLLVSKPVVNGSTISGGGTVNVNFNCTGLNSNNLPFVVDLYKSNANGDLVQYVQSSDIISVNANDNYSVAFAIPPTIILGSNDRIAITLSALGNASDPTTKLITSQAAYGTFSSNYCCSSLSFKIDTSKYVRIVDSTHVVVCQKADISFTPNSSDCQQSIGLTYTWSFGDGSAPVVSTSLQGVTHSYNANGPFLALLTVEGNGCEPKQYAVNVYVQDCCCDDYQIQYTYGSVSTGYSPVQFGTPITINPAAGDTLIIKGGSSCGLVYPTLNYGDGTPPVAFTPTPQGHIYQTSGPFNLVFTKIENGCDTSTTLPNTCCQGVIFSVDTGEYVKVINYEADVKAIVCQNGEILFTPDTVNCLGTGLTYTWNFGDGSPLQVYTTAQKAPHLFANTGAYQVTLTVSGSGCDSVTYTSNIYVVDCCCSLANINILYAGNSQYSTYANLSSGSSFNVSTATPNQNLYFNSVSLCNAGLPIRNVFTPVWNFGDGTPTVSGNNVVHQYATAGSYTATYTLSDLNCGTNSCCQGVMFSIDSTDAVKSFDFESGIAAAICKNGKVFFSPDTLNCSASGLSYTWNFGDGTSQVTYSSPQHPFHIFASVGTFSITLTVSGNNCTPRSFTSVVNVFDCCCDSVNLYAYSSTNPAHNAVFSNLSQGVAVSLPADQGETFTFYSGLVCAGSLMYLPGNIAPQITWDFGDGSPTVQGYNVTHTYQTADSYKVSFTLSNYSCPTVTPPQPCCTAVNITLQDSGLLCFTKQCSSSVGAPHGGVAPVGTTTCTYSAQACLNKPFSLSVVNSCSCSSLQYTWNFGDGSPLVTGCSINHTYASIGNYTISVVISGDTCITDSVIIPINVIDCCPPLDLSIMASHGLGGSKDTSTVYCSSEPVVFSISNLPRISSCSYADGQTGGGSSVFTPPTLTYLWNFGDGASDTIPKPFHVYTAPGTYTITVEVSAEGCPGPSTGSFVVTIVECSPPPPCEVCIGSFAPLPGEKYVLSAWVKQDVLNLNVTTYSAPNITLAFTGGGLLGPFTAKGVIIDGWQRIEEEFVVPSTASDIEVQLNNNSATELVYFDDIRVHPFNSNLKSFVYDPVSLRLLSELDQNNYATYYEYDEEGKLVRIKKETERGIKTIKESVNNTSKK